MQKIKVVIGGKEYALRFDGSPDFVEKCANSLNAQLDEVKAKSVGIDLGDALVIVALNQFAQEMTKKHLPKALETALNSEKSKNEKLKAEVEALRTQSPDSDALREQLDKLATEYQALVAEKSKLAEQLSLLQEAKPGEIEQQAEQEQPEVTQPSQPLSSQAVEKPLDDVLIVDINTVESDDSFGYPEPDTAQSTAEQSEVVSESEAIVDETQANAYLVEIEQLKKALAQAINERDELADKVVALKRAKARAEKQLEELRTKFAEIEQVKTNGIVNEDEFLAQLVELEKKAFSAEKQLADANEKLAFAQSLNVKLANQTVQLDSELTAIQKELEDERAKALAATKGKGQASANAIDKAGSSDFKTKKIEIELEDLRKKNELLMTRLREIVEDGQLTL